MSIDKLLQRGHEIQKEILPEIENLLCCSVILNRLATESEMRNLSDELWKCESHDHTNAITILFNANPETLNEFIQLRKSNEWPLDDREYEHQKFKCISGLLRLEVYCEDSVYDRFAYFNGMGEHGINELKSFGLPYYFEEVLSNNWQKAIQTLTMYLSFKHANLQKLRTENSLQAPEFKRKKEQMTLQQMTLEAIQNLREQ